ncbi:hypothetical protein OSTOST_21169 [Ostertagia ostertagi]
MSVTFDFHGKKALVTGASQGLGYGIAVALAKAGAEVVALARNEAKLEELRKEVRMYFVNFDDCVCLIYEHTPLHSI